MNDKPKLCSSGSWRDSFASQLTLTLSAETGPLLARVILGVYVRGLTTGNEPHPA